jgi:hypothetical protein
VISLQPGGWLLLRLPLEGRLRLHWSLPLAPALLSAGTLQWEVWAGSLGLLLLHGWGHARVLGRLRVGTRGWDLHAVGAAPRPARRLDRVEAALFAGGGVLMQATAALLGLVLEQIWGPPLHPLGRLLATMLWLPNLCLLVVNLLPLPLLQGDGPALWSLPALLLRPQAPAALPPDPGPGMDLERARRAQETVDALWQEAQEAARRDRGPQGRAS